VEAFTDHDTTTDLGPASTGQSSYGAALTLVLVSTT
jgi:hypothetical protein